MIKTFYSFDEAATALDTDSSGLSQALEINSISLPAFVHSRGNILRARLSEPCDRLGIITLPNGNTIGESSFIHENVDFDYSELADNLCDITFGEVVEENPIEGTRRYSLELLLEGYFRCDAYLVKGLARGSYTWRRIAPQSWWNNACSLLPSQKSGMPKWWLTIKSPPQGVDASDRWIATPRIVEDLLFRVEDIEKVKGGQIAEPRTPGDHVSTQLSLLNQAARKFWGNAAKGDRGTQPANRIVAAWLVEKGYSESLADKGASIIRPEWAPIGRKPDE